MAVLLEGLGCTHCTRTDDCSLSAGWIPGRLPAQRLPGQPCGHSSPHWLNSNTGSYYLFSSSFSSTAKDITKPWFERLVLDRHVWTTLVGGLRTSWGQRQWWWWWLTNPAPSLLPKASYQRQRYLWVWVTWTVPSLWWPSLSSCWPCSSPDFSIAASSSTTWTSLSSLKSNTGNYRRN